MDPVAERFRTIRWRYADKDDAALGELERRIASAGARRGLITYSELVDGVRFSLPNLRERERVIDTGDWEDLDRAIVGDFLGYLSMESYERGKFFASALVVGKRDGTPGEGFYALLKELKLIASSRSDKAMKLWAEHVAKAHQWYVSPSNSRAVRPDG
jgi:hypothetical protein